MKMNKYKSLFPMFGFVAGLVFSALIFLSYKNENVRKVFYDLAQKIVSVRMDKTFDFAGEQVPLNDDTKERMDRELNINAYWQSSTMLNIKLANKFFPVIEKILDENDIPDDCKYMAVAESGLRNATSSSGAKGYWQFMKPTAIELGLEISEDVDERMHLEKSTQAACTYLKQLYNRFGTWTNVAAAYNVGPTNFSKSLSEQKESSYYDMNINDETSRYVFRIIAIKEILSNPEDFGFYLSKEDKYAKHPDLMDVVVTETIPSLADFAHQYGISYRMLKFYNPWLLTGKLTVKDGKQYIIKIPKK